MSSQSGLISTNLRQERMASTVAGSHQPKPKLLLLRVILPLYACLVVVSLAVMIVAKTQPAIRIVAPPHDLLPGHPIPGEAQCVAAPYSSSCYAYLYTTDLNGLTAYLTPDMIFTTISSTLVLQQNYRMGDLFLAWGYPTGFEQ